MAAVNVTWVQGDQFVAASSGGHSVVLDAPAGRESWQGMMPSEMLLGAVAGCTAMDVLGILRKMRQHVTGLRVSAQGHQRDSYPRAFDRIEVLYELRGFRLSSAAVERAIKLSEEKYCMVAATVRGVAVINTSYSIEEDTRSIFTATEQHEPVIPESVEW